MTVLQSEAVLETTRKRAEGWRTGSASLVALIVASLALRSGTGWMTTFDGGQLYLVSGLIAGALLLALGSMWLTLRAAHGPFRLDTRSGDYSRPHDVHRNWTRARSAANNLRFGQALLWSGVLVFCLAAFATWLLDPQADSVWELR